MPETDNELTIDDKLINYNVELAIIKFLLKNPDKLPEYKLEHFLSKDSQICFNELINLNKINSTSILSIDEFSKVIAGNNKGKLESDILKKAFDQSDDITIEKEPLYKHKLLDSYIKFKGQKVIIEDIERTIKSKGYLDDKDLEKHINKLQGIRDELKGETESIKLYTMTDIYEEHCKIIDKRKEGLLLRTLGYKQFDQLLSRPAAGGEITTFASLTGLGKSLLLKNLEYRLMAVNYLNYKPCILSLNMEMSMEAITDRMLSIKNRFDIKDLQNRKTLELISKDVKKALRSYTEFKNYLYFSDPILDLKTLDTKVIPAAKKYFREIGLLPDDGYMVLAFDAATHLGDFKEGNANDYETAMKTQHILAQNHNCHCINLAQLNENKLRYGQFFKTHKDINHHVFGLEDIFGSSAIAKYSRAVFTFTRPKVLKERFFPMEIDEWGEEFGADGTGDVANVHLVKANDGKLGMTELVVMPNLLMVPKDEV